MPAITSTILRDLGCTNVIGVPMPVILINGVPVCTKIYEFESLKEAKDTDWFNDACAGAVLVVCDAESLAETFTLRAFQIPGFDGKEYNFSRRHH